MTDKAKTIAIFAFAAVIAWLGTLALGLWFLRPAETPPKIPGPPAAANTISAPLTDSPAEAPESISVQEAFKQLQEAALAGQTQAMLGLAEFYGRGLGVRQNFTERLHWLQKAAEAGDPRGIYLLALSRETGLGTPADPDQAWADIMKAAEMGLPEAHVKLAEGLIQEADQAQAVVHLEKALDAGLPLAANILGRLYLEGAGNLAADAEKARRFLLRGAELADPEAIKNLGVMFRQGWGGPAEPAQALKWFLTAIELGWPRENLEPVLVELEGQLAPQAIAKAKAEAKGWLEERKTSPPSTP